MISQTEIEEIIAEQQADLAAQELLENSEKEEGRMTDSVAPKNMEHLFYMAGGVGAWQHYNYYLEHYTNLPLLKNRDDIDNVSSVYCMVNKDKIVKLLAVDLFSVDLDSEKCEVTR